MKDKYLAKQADNTIISAKDAAESTESIIKELLELIENLEDQIYDLNEQLASVKDI